MLVSSCSTGPLTSRTPVTPNAGTESTTASNWASVGRGTGNQEQQRREVAAHERKGTQGMGT